jgi:alpha-galactosidase
MKYNYFPYPGSRHVAEFMPEYFNYFNHTKAFGITTLRDVYHLAKSHKWAIQRFRVLGQDFFKDYVPDPQKKGEKAMEMTTDWKDNVPNPHVVNIPNNGFVDNLPEGAIIEVPGFFKDGKMEGVRVGKLPDVVADLVRPFTKVYSLAAEAAVSGDRDLIVEALTKI